MVMFGIVSLTCRSLPAWGTVAQSNCLTMCHSEVLHVGRRRVSHADEIRRNLIKRWLFCGNADTLMA